MRGLEFLGVVIHFLVEGPRTIAESSIPDERAQELPDLVGETLHPVTAFIAHVTKLVRKLLFAKSAALWRPERAAP